MNNLFIGILVAIGLGAAAVYAISRVGGWAGRTAEAAGKWLGEKYDAATKPFRDGWDSLKEQAGQSVYERTGGPKPGENYFSELSRKEQERLRKAREEEKAKRPTQARIDEIKAQIKTAEQAGAAGVFDSDVFLTMDQLKAELALLESAG